MATKYDLAKSCQTIHGIKDLIPSVLGQHLDQRIQANYSLFIQMIEDAVFQAMYRAM